ncbi:MAG TPA: protein phosphatase 2C domain-containing protein [Chloroflexia bacterium]|nr:protein phosphatase 2C domain-containing protein [Chloroflexia bacterium]
MSTHSRRDPDNPEQTPESPPAEAAPAIKPLRSLAAEQREAAPDNGPAAEPAAQARPTGGNITTPLADAGGPPAPPLPEGEVVNERYNVVALVGVMSDTNIYRVTDNQGYKRCWACGSDSSMPGDIYCVECGAQLAGRFYRLQEYSLPTADDTRPSFVLPEAILENRIPGVAHVYDAWQDTEAGRGYVAWEESSGRTLASWLPGGTPFDEIMAASSGHLAVPQEPDEEQVLAWMVQAADLLGRLHAEDIAGCSLELANLLVQPGNRLTLLDPSGCRLVDEPDDQARAALELSDVRTLATRLEEWYMAVRKDAGQPTADLSTAPEGVAPMPTANGSGNSSANGGENGQATTYANGVETEQTTAPQPMVPAYTMTGPLGANLNTALVLARAREGGMPTAESFAHALRDLYEAAKPLTDLELWSGRASDVGQVRKINEDSVLTLEATVLEHEGYLPVALYVVADGMGGHQSGEVASSIAARTVGAMVNSSLLGPLVAGDPVARDPDTCARLLQSAVLEANRRITDLARERHSDLGTTVVAALLIGNQVTIANVGDSRAYLWHNGELQVITRDHSLVMQLVTAGQLSLDEIYTHPRRNEIYRALGDSRLTEEEIDIYALRLRPGDGLLLCSDGLWDFVRDPDIAAVLAAPAADPQTVAFTLVDRANLNGGEDNISVIFARVLSAAT